MSKFAWVTLTTNDSYALGALVLAHSLRRQGTAHQLAVLITPTVSEDMSNRLRKVYDVVQEVNVLDSEDAANLALLARPELGITFTKLHCWRLVQFDKCVFLDSDTLVLQNCDELFEREELSAAPDVSWPDCFNSGVFVYKPSLDTFAKITEFSLQHGSFDGGDQGLLNSYFADWAHTDIKKHLPFVYNVTAYASYCYLPAFKQFRDKIKILHFAGKLKPWLINFNSETKTASAPSDYAHAADLIQLWWNIFCDSVHQELSGNMNYWPEIMQWNLINQNYNAQDYYYDILYEGVHNTQNNNSRSFSYDDIEVRDYHDPWEDYYQQLELQHNNETTSVSNNWQQTVDNELDGNYRQPSAANIENLTHSNLHTFTTARHNDNNNNHQHHNNTVNEINSCEIVHNQTDENYSNKIVHNSSIIEITTRLQNQEQIEEEEEKQEAVIVQEVNNVHINEGQVQSQAQTQEVEEEEEEEDDFVKVIQAHVQVVANEHCIETEVYHCPKATNCTNITATISTTTTTPITTMKKNICDDETIERDINKDTYIESYHKMPQITADMLEQQQNSTVYVVEESGLAGALSQLRLGEPRSPEQEAYEQSMRRQAWEQGTIDYTGKDSFDNILKRITQTLDNKPTKASKDAADATTDLITSADIEDGKIEYDPVTKAKIEYKVVDGGYQVITTTPQPNGTLKTQTQTFWDPKPVSAEELIKEQENKKLVKQRMGKEIRVDHQTTMLTREIEGGYEEVYTTVNEDGTKSVKVKTFYDSVPEGQSFPNAPNAVPQKNASALDKKKKQLVSRNSSVDSTDSTESRKVVQRKNVMQSVSDGQNTQTNAYQEESTYQETRRMSQNVEFRQNSHSVRKNSVQEQNIQAITSSNYDSSKKDSKKKKKTKSSIPPPPSDFIENDTTKVSSRRVPGGVEYTYTTQLDSGKTITTSKTIYEEEETELTEEEIREYKKTLKDAEKLKNVNSSKKLKSESGTKKIVPSENPGDVTTVETIKIEGGTEYHYTTVTSEGIVKKAVKTVFDPVPINKYEDDTEEEEIVEEYEEEIIEPGEKTYRTIESIKKLPTQFSEEVTITKEKKEKKVKRSMIMSN